MGWRIVSVSFNEDPSDAVLEWVKQFCAFADWCGAGPGGVWVCRADGTLLGRIVLPELPANLGWGEDGSVLFLTARTSVYRLATKTRGRAGG